LFADRVAKLSISEYKKQCPVELQDSYKQTVLASFLIHRKLLNTPLKFVTALVDDGDIKHTISNSKLVQYDESTLEVVSIGVGTKILPKRKVIDEFRCSKKTGTTLFIRIIV
jgi:uncharacterized membrane protein